MAPAIASTTAAIHLVMQITANLVMEDPAILSAPVWRLATAAAVVYRQSVSRPATLIIAKAVQTETV